MSSPSRNRNTRNSVPNRFVEERPTRNFVISFRTIPGKIKMLGIPFRTILQKRKTLRISFQTLSSEENLWKLVPNHSRAEKNTWLQIFFGEFWFFTNLGKGHSKTHRIPRKSTFFRGTTKTLPSLFRGIFRIGISVARKITIVGNFSEIKILYRSQTSGRKRRRRWRRRR
jgi:hypothetical protein